MVFQNKQALVIGGSIAGLLAAKVLTKYFEKVTIVERDHFPKQPEDRQGVPQAPHVHVLLKRGQQILEELFPGIDAELASLDAPSMDWGVACPWLGFSGWAPRFNSGLITRNYSRNLLEWTIRRRLATNNRVVFMEAGQVISLLSNFDQTSVTGVRVRFRNQPETDISADLVVDASGRNSQSPQFLERMGYLSPQQTVIKPFLGYASRWFQKPIDLKTDWRCVYVTVQPPNNSRGGAIYQIENNRWILVLIGMGRDYPPTNEVGFIEFARSLRSPILYETIKDAQPISPIYAYQRTENRLRHYDKLARLPEGFVILGDAVCAFNPVYGQGMTTAALGALTLDKCLSQKLYSNPDRNLIGLPQYFQKQLSKVIAVPWLMTTGEDLRWHTTEGKRPNFKTQLMQRYLEQVLLLQSESADIHKTFLEVMHMVKPPSEFFQPNIIGLMLKRLINHYKRSSAKPSNDFATEQKV
ncbi:2-polyprenyl-6-methoxyphenol hydroxylase-like oxidoreductase [Hapalosiphon sp. MRB220]|nr:2-polyprenyl-6-methoxyphenol hydroxylase-like oxidoreductase [Hapalosiphon sp. MRB220]